MAKLNQILAIEKGVKSRTYGAITEIDRRLQREQLLAGIARTYAPKDDDGDMLPAEFQQVQLSVPSVLDEVRDNLAQAWDITYTKEAANQDAKADIALDDGTIVLRAVPVTYLLYLEKQLTDFRTLAGRLPLLDPAQKWEFDATINAYAAEPRGTVRTKKIPRRFVKYDATPEHPAQVEVFNEDEIVGTWTTIQFSGAMPASERAAMLDRTEKLLMAVKKAREAANNMDVTNQTAAEPLLDFLLTGASASSN